MGSSYFRWKC